MQGREVEVGIKWEGIKRYLDPDLEKLIIGRKKEIWENGKV